MLARVQLYDSESVCGDETSMLTEWSTSVLCAFLPRLTTRSFKKGEQIQFLGDAEDAVRPVCMCVCARGGFLCVCVRVCVCGCET